MNMCPRSESVKKQHHSTLGWVIVTSLLPARQSTCTHSALQPLRTLQHSGLSFSQHAHVSYLHDTSASKQNTLQARTPLLSILVTLSPQGFPSIHQQQTTLVPTDHNSRVTHESCKAAKLCCDAPHITTNCPSERELSQLRRISQ